MTKKILALAVSIIMVMSLFCAIPVSAETLPSNLVTDYEPGEKIDAITTEKLSATYSANSWPNDVASTTDTFNDVSAWKIATSTQNAASVQASGGWGVQGYSIGTFADKSEVFKAGKNVIVSFEACRWSDSTACVDPIMNVAIRQDNGLPIYPIEYPSGVSVSHTDWQTYTFTLPIPEGAQAGNLSLVVGFHYTQDNQGRRGFWIKQGTISVNTEYAYDIDVTADETSMIAGVDSITLDADVLNQTGNEGNISQNVRWYALNATREEEVAGIKVTPAADGTAQVTADSTVPAGTYYLVAVAEEDTNLVKGVPVEVVSLATDFTKVPLSERTDNAIINPYGWAQTGQLTRFNASTGADNYSGLHTIGMNKATSQYAEDAVTQWAADGIQITKNEQKSTLAQLYQPGATLVFSASVNSHYTNNPKLTWGIYQGGKKTILPMEYPTRADGFVTSSTAWTRFGATVAIPQDCADVSQALFSFGFSKMDAPESGEYAVNINAASMYLAAEAASDITVSADKNSVEAGEESTITVDADVLNQVDYTGNLSQDVSWYALNAGRTSEVSGFDFADGANGTATVTVADTVPVGTYKLVAVAESNKALIKAVTIEVTGAPITETTITSDGTNVTVSAKDTITNAILIFVKYDSNGKMIAKDLTNNAVSVSANATTTIAIPDDFKSGTVKIMLWQDLTSCEPLTAAID